jgi:hypothetical protein
MVVFNYDRCIEHYLFHALQNYYGIPREEAAVAMGHLEVHHPYGQVGDLPWANPRSNIEFGTDPNSRQLLDVAKQIKTFTEGTDPAAPEFRRITELMRDAPQVVFLGFAYHRLNLDLLFPVPTPAVADRTMFGTAYGLSQSDADHIENHLVQRAGVGRHRVNLGRELTCAGLFQEYWRALSLV